MRSLFLCAFIAVLVLLGIYFYFFFRRMLLCFVKGIQGIILHLLPAAGGLLAAAIAYHIMSVWAIAILYLFGFSICMDILFLTGKKIWPGLGRRGIWRTIYRCGLVPVLCSALMMGYGFWNMNQMIRTDYRIVTEKTAGEKGSRIVLISDLHYGTIKGLKNLQTCVRRIEEAKPDLVVLCGDLVDEGTTQTRF